MNGKSHASTIFGWLALSTLLCYTGVGFSQSVPRMPPPGPPGGISSEALAKAVASFRRHGSISEPAKGIQRGQVVGTWKALIILIDFPGYGWDHRDDENFPNEDTYYTAEHFDDMLFSVASYKDPNSLRDYTGSMRDFYRENSYGQFDLEGITTVWYRAAFPMSYYANSSSGLGGASPHNARTLVAEAIQLADPDVDYSEYDNNNDGRVDGLFVVHAGPGAEAIYSSNYSAHFNYLWSHKGGINPQLQLDGVTLSDYTLEPEDGSIGVFCHEFGHALGLGDLYDTEDIQTDASEGIGEWGLMGSGGWCHRPGDPLGTSPAHLTAWSKERLGWIETINVTGNLSGVIIPPIETNPIAYRIWRDGVPGVEYFLVENRQPIGFDAGLTRRQNDFGLPSANGLIIYHVDGSGQQWNEERRLIDVEEASRILVAGEFIQNMDLERIRPSHQFLYNGNRGDNGDPFPGYSAVDDDSVDFVGPRNLDVFDAQSSPNSNDNDGEPTGVSISNISFDGLNIVADLLINNVTSIERSGLTESLPGGVSLQQNYPNPFNPTTTIRFSLPKAVTVGTNIKLDIYTLTGQWIRTLFTGSAAAGQHRVSWDGKDDFGTPVSSGLYVYRLSSGDWALSKKMIVLR